MEPPPIMEEILSAVASLERAELGVVRLFDRDRGELETVVSLGMPPAYVQRYGRLPIGVEACELAVERGGLMLGYKVKGKEKYV
jgi:hypothetical protein